MRKTRLVLIPGVKSLDTIGCLLLFLACPTIAFKGQENREVDTICKAQNLKEFWVDSLWPGETDNIGWARGYGGGIWPGNSRELTCKGLSSRSVVLPTRRSNDRREQAEREASRDDGIGSRKTPLNSGLRDTRRGVIGRRTDSLNIRRVALNEERRMDSRRDMENRASSRARSLNREIISERENQDSRRMSFTVKNRSTEQRTVTTREQIDGKRNSKVPSRNAEREIRTREVGKPENRRSTLNRERPLAVKSFERLTVRNREVIIDGRSDSRFSIRSHRDNKSGREMTNDEVRIIARRSGSPVSDDRLKSVDRRVANSRREEEASNARLATSSLETSERKTRDIESQIRDWAPERRTISDREVVNGRRLSVQSLDRRVRYVREVREPDVGRAARFRRPFNVRLHNENPVENRQDYRLTGRTLERQITSKREVPSGTEHRRKQESFAVRVTDDFRSVGQRRDSRAEHENSGDFRASAGSKREKRSVSQSFEGLRSSEERRIDNRRLTVGRQDSSLPIRAVERGVRSGKVSSNNPADRHPHSSPANSDRGSANIIRTEVEKETENVRASPQSGSRRVRDVQRSADRPVRRQIRVQLQRSTRSLEERTVLRDNFARDVRRLDSRRDDVRDILRAGRYSSRFVRGTDERHNEGRQDWDRTSAKLRHVRSRSSEDIRRMQQARAEWETRQLNEMRTLRGRKTLLVESSTPERTTRGFVGAEHAEINFVSDESRSQSLARRVYVRSIGDVRRTQRAESRRDDRMVDNDRSKMDRTATIRASRERLLRLAADAQHINGRRVMEKTRTETRSLQAGPEKSHRLSQADSETRRSPHVREIRNTVGRFEREYRQERRDDHGNGQRRLLQEARSRDDVRRFDPKTPIAQTQRETFQSDSRRGTETRRNPVRNALGRLALQNIAEEPHRLLWDDYKSRERERRFEREGRQERPENKQRRLGAVDFRQINGRNARDTEMRRISRDVALTFKLRSIADEVRRSERQRRFNEDSPRFVDKSRRNGSPSEQIRLVKEHVDGRRSLTDSRKIYGGKHNVMLDEIGQELSNEGAHSFFGSSKNILTRWMTADISNTHPSGIAETLMYGGIACFALFSNVNKKFIF